ncbi:Os07g0538350, partial [Oryza sativa Japonica Group]
EATPAARRRQVRSALRPAVHLGELRVEVGLPGRVPPPRGVARRVVGGGVHQRCHEAVEPCLLRRGVRVAVEPVNRDLLGGEVAGGDGGVGVGEQAGVVEDGGDLVVGAGVGEVEEGLGEAGEAGGGVGVAAAEREGGDLVRRRADALGGGEQVRRGRGVAGEGGGDEVDTGK